MEAPNEYYINDLFLNYKSKLIIYFQIALFTSK